MHYCAKVLIFLRKAARRRSAEEISRKEMKGGNGATIGSAVTLCLNHAYQNDAAENHTGSRTKSAAARRRSQSALPRVCQYPLPLVALLIQPLKKISRKVREVRKVIKWRPLCGGSLQKSSERGKPIRSAGSRLSQPPKEIICETKEN